MGARGKAADKARTQAHALPPLMPETPAASAHVDWNVEESALYANMPFFMRVLAYLNRFIGHCTSVCMICNKPLKYSGLRPTICGDALCVWTHEKFGFGLDMISELNVGGGAVKGESIDLLVSLAYASANHPNADYALDPFPDGVRVQVGSQTVSFQKSGHRDKDLVVQKLRMLPPMKDLVGIPNEEVLKRELDARDPMLFHLLRWLITSNPSLIQKVTDEEQKIPQFGDMAQFRFLSLPPDRAEKFMEMKRKKGSFYAFHGSPFHNWHSIIRYGLKNFSNTKRMTCGAAYGPGIYLGKDMMTSMGYTGQGYAYQSQQPSSTGPLRDRDAKTPEQMLKDRIENRDTGLTCMAVCEVIRGDVHNHGNILVEPDEAQVATRMLLIFDEKTVQRKNVDGDEIAEAMNRIFNE
eukprot:GAFH01001187.1.p2 GENE.GAFH01001187.1~~GAFH01001187.1.p2  ORF type:complete len:454 (-),score=210.44 GAFH01001187.1:491-1717(-)